MSTITTRRGTIYYVEKPGTRTTLLFLHGNLATSRWWEPVIALLPNDWRCIAYDACGFGQSQCKSVGLERYSIPGRLQDLIVLVEALGLELFHLVAHSTATPIAIEYALMLPEMVATLSLIDPVPVTGGQTPQEAFPLLEQLVSDRKLLSRALHASAPHMNKESSEFLQYLDDIASLEPQTLPAIARGLDAWRPGDRIRQLKLPVMIVRGEDDIMLGDEEAHFTLLSIPGARQLEILHGAGHSPMIETPNGLASLLTSFIAEELGEDHVFHNSM